MTRNPRRGSANGRRRNEKQTSVLGSTLGDASSRLRARGVPRSGIRMQDGLKVADGALPDTTIISESARGMGPRILRIVALVSGSLAVILLLFTLVLAIFSHTAAFKITSVKTFDTDHVSAQDVAQLIHLDPDATLLNVDTEALANQVRSNSWIGSVQIESSFPDTLVVHTRERSVGALVAMRSGGICWLLGDDGVWIEPVRVESSDDETAEDAALANAEQLGVILISDVPSDVSPVAGTVATDASIKAALEVNGQLSPSFKSNVAGYAAPDEEGITCILKNGVEVSLGSTSNLDTKEAVAQGILNEFGGQITYINVRVPSRPSYRRVESTYVREGTGATGVAIDEESNFANLPQRPPESDDAYENEEIPDEYLDGSAHSSGSDESTYGYGGRNTGSSSSTSAGRTSSTNGYGGANESSTW